MSAETVASLHPERSGAGSRHSTRSNASFRLQQLLARPSAISTVISFMHSCPYGHSTGNRANRRRSGRARRRASPSGRAAGIRRPEEGHDRRADGRGQVHRARVVRDEHARAREQRGEPDGIEVGAEDGKRRARGAETLAPRSPRPGPRRSRTVPPLGEHVRRAPRIAPPANASSGLGASGREQNEPVAGVRQARRGRALSASARALPRAAAAAAASRSGAMPRDRGGRRSRGADARCPPAAAGHPSGAQSAPVGRVADRSGHAPRPGRSARRGTSWGAARPRRTVPTPEASGVAEKAPSGPGPRPRSRGAVDRRGASPRQDASDRSGCAARSARRNGSDITASPIQLGATTSRFKRSSPLLAPAARLVRHRSCIQSHASGLADRRLGHLHVARRSGADRLVAVGSRRNSSARIGRLEFQR